MKKRVAALMLALIMLSFPAFADSGDALTDFGVKWLSLDSVGGSENPVFSPASAYFALSMVALGAKGDTLDQIRALTGDENAARDLMSSLIEKRGETKISIANSAWLDHKYELNADYSEKLAEGLSAEAFKLKLSSEEAVERINAWVNEKTEGMIPKTISEPFSDDACLALASTIYFNGSWLHDFAPENTLERTFVRDDGEYVKAQFMETTAPFGYCENGDGSKCVTMKYTDGDTAMLAILPPSGVKASEYIRRLNAEAINGILSSAESKTINLVIPKIEASGDYDLVETLKALGVTDAFDMNKSDLSGMLSDPSVPVWVSKALHKAKLSMGEKGTEAAAVTIMAMAAGSAPGYTPPPSVRFERSFIYMLMDLRTNSALFMGIVNDPSLFDLSEQNVSSGWNIENGAPRAYVSTERDGGYLTAGNYTLDDSHGLNVIACGEHPLEYGEYVELDSDDGVFEIYANIAPSNAIVRYWSADCIGDSDKYESGFGMEESKDMVFKLDAGEKIVVELTLEWSEYSDLSGTASYAFLLNGGK